MAIWNRKEPIKESQKIQEASRETQLSLQDLVSLPYYNFASQLTSLRGMTTTSMNSTIKEAMLKDPIISMIINMWISDTLSKDVLTNKVYDVEIKRNADAEISDEAINKINSFIDYLQENSNLDELLEQILYKVITDGITSVKLGFVDSYEDTKIKLFESNKKKILSESQKWDDDFKKKLLEAPSYDDYEDELYRKRTFNSTKLKRLLGRFYFELLPAHLIPLKHKGITILYMDLHNSQKVLNPKNITTFVNTRGGVKTLSIKDDPEDIVSTTYEIPLGQSFIENAVTPWSMMNTTEDCTLLALMTRSAIYRVFQIDVGAMSTKETEKFVQEFKKRITSRETIDVRGQHYSSAQTQVPLGDSIIVPTRNGVGTINVQAVGGDLDIKTETPLDYFREQLLASLGVPKALVYGDESGALINTSATRSDIRYLRTVQQFTRILSRGLEAIFKDYLAMLGVNLKKISLKVKFSQINSEEALQRIEYEQTKQEALDRAITSLSNLGISFENGAYHNTRDELIKRFIDSELLEVIKKDEEELAQQPPEDPNPFGDDSEGNDEGLEALPSGSNLAEEPIDVNLSGGGEENSEIEELPSVENTGEVEPTTNANVNEEVPYSLS